MIEKYFLDVPVYRIDENEYHRRRDNEIESSLQKVWQDKTPSAEQLESGREDRKVHFFNKYGPWEFNEIVGYIRLHLLGSQIRGVYFSAEGKRTVLSRKRVFKWVTHKLAPECNLRKNLENQDLYDTVHQYLDRCQDELRSDRHIDRRTLNALGPFLDWRALLERDRNLDQAK